MIPVHKQPQPANFFKLVERPGLKFLVKNPHPQGEDWSNHHYWRRVENELYEAYAGICAYSCHWIPRITGARTIEHFKPKNIYPQEAYNWDNYRLVCSLLNGRKGIFEDVLDPFTLKDGWFVLDFPSLMIFPGDQLSIEDATKVTKTIERLKLNFDEECLKEREKWLREYVIGEISFSHLERHAPFIALELQRQELVERTHPLWAKYRQLN